MSLAELSEERTFWENFLKNLREDYYMPRIRMEIVIGEMFSAGILEDIVRKKLEKDDIKYITKEFPIRCCWATDNAKNNYSTFSVDYLMGSVENSTLYFVELKTNSEPINKLQKNRYLNVIQKIKEINLNLYRDYEDIVAHSKDGKYEHRYRKQKEQIERDSGESYFKSCNNIKLIYITRKDILKVSSLEKEGDDTDNNSDIINITFSNLFKNINKFEKDTQIFLKICQEIFSDNKS